MIKTIKQTISNIYYWIKKKLIKFKKWFVLIIFGAAVVAAPLVLPPNIPDIALENIQADYHASELKDKYRLEKTAFILDAIDENAIQAEVGNKNSDEFLPELTLRKWSDEVNLKVKHRHNEKKKDLKFELDGKKIKLKGKKIETHFYEVENAYEFEIILLEKPDVNVVEFDIESKGLKFYYQPELTQKEKDDGAFRPENVIGSYAVYHESKAGDYSKMGLKNYRAGKAFHIYRPKIIDSAGTEVWGKLNITDNLLTVEIPQEFLDNAVYPVRHAAGLTFGYNTLGSTSAVISANYAIGSFMNTSVSTGDIDSYHIGAMVYTSTKDVKGFVVNASTLAIINNSITDAITIPINAGLAWYNFNYSTKPSINSANTYSPWVVVETNSTYIVRDTGGSAGDSKYETDNNYASPTNPSSLSNSTSRYSIYCTYTAGGAERRMFLTQ